MAARKIYCADPEMREELLVKYYKELGYESIEDLKANEKAKKQRIKDQ